MGTDTLIGQNIVFPIYNADETPFYNLVLRKATYDSVVMSLGDKITGDVMYKDNSLIFTMSEYIEYNGVKYVLVNPPTTIREGMMSDNNGLGGMTKYTLEFYHPMYMLGNFPFNDVAVSQDELKYLSQNKTFSWIGTCFDFIDKLNNNLVGTQWYVEAGENNESRAKMDVLSDVLSFDKNTIAQALKTAYDTWKVPFTISTMPTDHAQHSQNKRFLITFGLPTEKIYDEQGNEYIFRFGQGVGLKNNSRTPRKNKIVTRIAGFGSTDNIPYGYPQIVWTGNQDWDYTINNASGMQNITVDGRTIQAMSYPIYDGIVGGQNVRLIKHPFTRDHLMPSIYTETVNKKVNPNAVGYNPDIEIVDYYDALPNVYPNPIVPDSPSYEIHEFDKIKPRLNENSTIVDAWAYAGASSHTTTETMDDPNDGGNVSEEEFHEYMRSLYIPDGSYYPAINSLAAFDDAVRVRRVFTDKKEGGAYNYEWSVSINSAGYIVARYVSDRYNINKVVVVSQESQEEEEIRVDWNDAIDEDGNYVQSYFKIKLPQLSFDVYASAAITEEMKINMRSGACIGCTFPIQVDWEDYKNNFYDSNGKFDPVIGEGHPRDATKYPDSSSGSITVVVKKENETFGTIMPNIYQQPNAGDKFVILGISLPTSYITSAEQELDDAMMEYMLENNVYYYDYPIKFDEYFLATHTNILAQIHNNIALSFKYASETKVLYVKHITIKYGEKVLPTYDITLSDDIDIVLNQIGQVTDDVSRLRVELSELLKYYGGGNADALNEKLSRVVDDVAQGRITFQEGIDVLSKAVFSQELCSPDYRSGLYDGKGWHIDNLGNSEFESIRVRSFLEVVELLVNRLQAQEGDTLFTDNDQIEKVQPEFEVYQCQPEDNPKSLNLYERTSSGNGNYVYTPTLDTTANAQKTYYRIRSYILSLKEKYDGYFTPQRVGNILKGIINTLAAKQANVSDEESKSVETDGDNKYYTSWMRVTGTHASHQNEIGTNQIRVELYSDDYDTEDPETHETIHHHFTPAGINFPPCELMTVARWGCYLDPDEEGISSGEKESRERRQRMFMISVTDGRVVKYTKVNSPILGDYNYGVTIGELPQFVKNYPDVSSVLSKIGEHTDWLYAQGVVVGKFIKVDINGKPEVTIVDCGEWVNGGAQGVVPTPRNGIYYHDAWNPVSQQYETHDVWHNNIRWRCLVSQPIKNGQIYTYNEPTENSVYWEKMQGAIEGKDGTSAVSIFKWNNSPTNPPEIPTEGNPPVASKAYPPTGWSTSAPARPSGDNQHLWMSTANLVGNNTVDAWSTPVRISGDKGDAGADADDREWIYIADTEYRIPYADATHNHPKNISNGEVSPEGIAQGNDGNKNQNDWVPNGWSDRAIATNDSTNLFVYTSWRDKGSDGNWGNFQDPILWSNWGVQGLDGDGIQYIFKLFDHELSSSERVAQIPDNAIMNSNGEWMPQNQSPATKNNDWYDDAPSTTPSMPFCYCSTIKQIRGEWEKTGQYGKFNTLALWSKWSEDGESAPFYFDEWFAWSDDETTSSVNTSPTIIGSWSVTIPQKNAKYLWRKSIKYVLNTSSNTYTEQPAEYFRMSGTDGASIKTKGTAVVVVASSGSFPTNATSAGYKTGNIGLKQGDSTPYKATVNGSTASWSKNGMSASNDGDSYTITKDCTIDLDGDGTSANIKGHLVTWSEEANKWVDLGEFKGEDGKTYYSHIVWAANVIYSGTTVISVVDYTAAKSPNDTTHLWMGTHVDENAEDPVAGDEILKEYTWSYTKGADGVSYFIESNVDSVSVDSDSSIATQTSLTFNFFKITGDSQPSAYSAYFSTWRRTQQNYTRILYATQKTTSTTFGYPLSSAIDAIVIFITADLYTANTPPTNAIAKKEVAIIPRGADGADGAQGKMGRFYYYAGKWSDVSSSEQFVVSDVQAPYFLYDDQYWVFNPESNDQYTKARMGTPSSSDVNWKLMVDDFKYIITEAIFGSYAHLGAAIINDDYILSQHGYMRGYGGQTREITNSTQYIYADPDDMFGEQDLAEKPHIVNDTYEHEIQSTTKAKVLSQDFHLSAGRYYTIEINGYCDSNGYISYNIKKTDAEVYPFQQGVIKGYSGDGVYYPSYAIFYVSQDGDYNIYCSKSNASAIAEVRGIYILEAQFVPNWCVDLKLGKMVANNITARGKLHADSFYYLRAHSNSNNDTITIKNESIVTLGQTAVGTTVVLPRPTENADGHVIEIHSGMNISNGWYLSWNGMMTSNHFLNPYSGNDAFDTYRWSNPPYQGLYARTQQLTGIVYMKLMCQKINNSYTWAVIKEEAVKIQDGIAILLNPLTPIQNN